MTVLVLMETAGNQRYIFSSNKLKDVVGASELVSRSTTNWLNTAIGQLPEPQRLAVDVIMQSSGKALLSAPDETTARAVISHVSSTAMELAPGLDLFGIWIEAPDLKDHEVVATLLSKLHQRLEAQRTAGGGLANRSRRRSVVSSWQPREYRRTVD